MPIFINEVVFRGVVPEGAGDSQSPQSSTGASSKQDQKAVAKKAAQHVFDHLERELDRIGDR